MGLWGISVPEKFGGGGLDMVTACLLEEELGRASEGAREAETLRARKEQVRERLNRLLRVLEAVEIKEKEKEEDLQSTERQS